MAEVTDVVGLGQDGFFRYQKEAAYGTPLVASLIDVPVKEGTDLGGYQEFIENKNIVNDRTRQEPDLGKAFRPFNIILDAWITLLGDLMTLFGGGWTSAADGAADGSYDHYQLAIVTGERVGESFTGQLARGQNLVDQSDGAVANEVTISGSVGEPIQFEFKGTGQGFTDGVARGSSFTYPTHATANPFKFSHVSIVVTKADTDTILTCMESFELNLNYNQDMERYKMCTTASAEVRQPVFNDNPMATLTMNVDADQWFLTEARAGNKFGITLTFTHTLEAGTTPSYYQMDFEFPGCRLDPSVTIPHGNGRQNVDLTFTCDYGGTTTNSGAAIVPWEIRLTDAIATHI